MPKLGERMSEAQKRKIAKAHIGVQTFLGRKHSEKTKQKIRLANLGSNNHQWKGGRIADKDGYILLKSEDHPHKRQGGYVYEHRLVMERHPGRYLKPQEVVHHKNHINTDNRIKNLELFSSHSAHIKHHQELECVA